MFPVIRHNDTLLNAIESFSWGMHRILVVGENGSAIKILTQTDVVAYLVYVFVDGRIFHLIPQRAADQFREIMNAPIDSFGIGGHHVVTANASLTALEGKIIDMTRLTFV